MGDMEADEAREEGSDTVFKGTSSFQIINGVPILTFDPSVENFFSSMEYISKLCGGTKEANFDASEIENFKSMIVFLREWKQFYFCEWTPFHYKPKTVNFTLQTGSAETISAVNGIKLPPLSSAAVPKLEKVHSTASAFVNDNFILHVGGSIWALDWCPRFHENISNGIKCEYLAIAAHPYGSEHHKIGQRLSGRGCIQIWCFLHSSDEEFLCPEGVSYSADSCAPKLRGRPRKMATSTSNELNGASNNMLINPSSEPSSLRGLAVSNKCGVSSEFNMNEELRNLYGSSDWNINNAALKSGDNPIEVPKKCRGRPKKIIGANALRRRGRPRKHPLVSLSPRKIAGAKAVRPRGRPRKHSLVSLLSPGSNGNAISFSSGHRKIPETYSVPEKAIEISTLGNFNYKVDAINRCSMDRKREVKDLAIISCDDNDKSVKAKGLSLIREDHDYEIGALPSGVDGCKEVVIRTDVSVQDKFCIPDGIALPRLMLSLAHNGKVTWDMKWRPLDAVDSNGKHHVGYLAVLLGNGSLEVWEVPEHRLVKHLYTSCHCEGTDPRFLKLLPVFKCSNLMFGERQSIPLTLEWSPSASRNLIIAGCHDGTVALWKFSPHYSSPETRPLLCFTADTVPIRCLAWAPDDSDAECSNLIVIAGHEGLKFWNLRSPYRPLLELCPVQRAVLGLDWLQDPRCLVIAYEDGFIRTLSLANIANDLLVSGDSLSRTKQPGMHSQFGSIFTIWSVHVSRSTGLAAYCSSDGCTCYFQLTANSVGKYSSRHRKPHFLCGSLIEEDSSLTINTFLTSIPLPKQPFASKAVANEAARPSSSSAQDLCWYDDQTIMNNNDNDADAQRARKDNPRKKAKVGEYGDAPPENNAMKFPPKTVAMHKVRWNMNRGSGRWLCYGGAAGIVRCQAIYAPNRMDNEGLKVLRG